MKRPLLLCMLLLMAPSIGFGAEGIDINIASLEELDALAGIGPAIGQRIIDARPFSAIDDLLTVKGIGEKTLADIKAQGLAYVSGEPAPAPPAGGAGETPSSDVVVTVAKEPTYPGNVFITALLPNPEGPDETDEWISLYNGNAFAVNLAGWKLSDTAGSTTTYAMPADTVIAAQKSLRLWRPTTKILLNNEGDGLVLKNPTGATADSMQFGKAPLGSTYQRYSGGWQWSSGKTPTPAATAQEALSKNNEIGTTAVSGTAGLAEQIPLTQTAPGSNPWHLFYGALGISAALGAGALFAKHKLTPKQS